MRRWEGEIGGLRCSAERFRGPDDLVAYMRTPAVSRHTARTDWFNGDTPHDTEWSGFRHPEEVVGGLRTGIGAEAYSGGPKEARTVEVERLAERRRDVAGGAVIVPALVAGEPACMWTLRRRKVRSRTVALCVDTGMVCSRTPEQYREAGRAVTDAVISLERAGYRVRLDVAYTSHIRRSGFHVIGFAMPLKGMGEPINLRRCMWCLTEVAFMRGAGFAWQAHQPDMRDPTLGTDIARAWFGRDRSACEDEYFGRLSPGSAHICMSDAADMAAMHGRDAAAQWVASQLVV